MNRRLLVLGAALAAIVVFAAGGYLYTQSNKPPAPTATVVSDTTGLERFHSPVMGDMNAPVTIVEFLDPSCEACRAFYPIVKQIMDRDPGKVRLVIRYTPFHNGSDEAVRILEAARKQNLFQPVLEALFAGQPSWAADGSPNLQQAWGIAATAGLDLTKARQDATGDDVTAVLVQDKADVERFKVSKTPTFFVNGRELVEFGPQQLAEAVTAAIAEAEAQ